MAGSTQKDDNGQVLALCGGVGGAKLALGLYRVLGPDRLTLVVNTGDDFEHLGLHISPDLDTVTYTLAGLSNTELGWGRANETWTFMAAVEALGGESWFRLGDGDLATHVERTRRLRAGESLTAIAGDFAARLGIRARLLPMTDDPVRTVVHTADGALPFQHYFVRLRCAPVATGFSFEGAAEAKASPDVLQALADPDLRAVVLCPSNPYLSIDPILALPDIRSALLRCAAPVVAVSPIVGGRAVKGPTAKIMAELGIPASSAAVADHYRGLLDGLVLDRADASEAAHLDLPIELTGTVMSSLQDRERLAKTVLAFAERLGSTAKERRHG
ncbi:2-phospho-L-lactate transferase [Rhodospirillaceae bacterium SYSU D60014]|uniref:2-phospho-L-lactate transferase n=1 Tax=Virgifigura deserti TaxID=2268457 RepID=UPI000E6624B0